MRVVLLKDVAGVGQKGSVKNVSDGYASNFLIPRKLAEMATREKVSELEKLTKEAELKLKKQEGVWEEYAERLKGARVTLRMGANEHGQLYRQIPGGVVTERLRIELGIIVSEEAIVFDAPVKHTGRSTAHIQLGKRLIPIELIVERE